MKGGDTVIRKGDLPELLAPAGSFEALVAAIEAGADAVYVGGKSFGARAFAKNFEIDELERAAVYCRLNSVKLYVTVNTLVYDRETEDLKNYIIALNRIRPDAVIVADLGAVRLFRSLAPDLELHASTQMSIHNIDGANAAASLGLKRVVLARELPLTDIKTITKKASPEIEIFLHGALCVCHSGQCLMSSLVGGRSGNRGECAQPCRLPYNDKYPLSLRDLSLAGHIEELIDSGVSSLKIEGRMKSPSYVFTVTKIYRRLLDGRRSATAEESAELARAFSRDGFTDAYFTGKHSVGMTGVRSEGDKQGSKELEQRGFLPRKLKLTASASFKLGEMSRLTLNFNGKSVTAYGNEPSKAENSPLTADSVKDRLSKMGNTFFALSKDDIELTLDGGINLSPGAINALRRRAVLLLEGASQETEASDFSLDITPKRAKKRNTALFLNAKTLNSLVEKNEKALRFFDIIFAPLDFSFQSELVNGIYLPPIIFEGERQKFEELLQERAESVKYALCSNLSHIAIAKSVGLIPIGDFRLNVCNSLSRAEYESLGLEDIILSPEITLPMARDIGGGEIVCGRIPLMLTERCFVKENFGCSACGTAAFRDRRGKLFPIIREWKDRNIILNSDITYMGDRQDELDKAGVGIRHFIFSTEKPDEITQLISSYKKAKKLNGVRRIGSRGV